MTRIGQGAAAMMLLAGASAATTATAAQEICGARADLLEELTKRYHEAPAAVGLANSGVLVEVLTADNGSTWTIIVSQPNGTSCLVAAGKEWQELKRTASRDLRV
ncbi:MAG: hypothetical protein AB7S71_05795 [Dongiaceae bacterium]